MLAFFIVEKARFVKERGGRAVLVSGRDDAPVEEFWDSLRIVDILISKILIKPNIHLLGGVRQRVEK